MIDLKKKVKVFIANCITCILSNRKEGRQEGFLNPIPKEDTPLHTFHVDHVGKLSSTSKNYKHLLVVIDGFTKFTWIFAVKSTTSREAIQKLNVIHQHFGNPARYKVH